MASATSTVKTATATVKPASATSTVKTVSSTPEKAKPVNFGIKYFNTRRGK